MPLAINRFEIHFYANSGKGVLCIIRVALIDRSFEVVFCK
jgi:hypothetical protein